MLFWVGKFFIIKDMKEKKFLIKILMLVRRRVNKNDCNENDKK